MQMRDEWKRARKWKVAAGVGTAAALGLAGVAFASPADVTGAPSPITLQREVVAAEAPPSTPTTSWAAFVAGYEEVKYTFVDSTPTTQSVAADDTTPTSQSVAADDTTPTSQSVAADDTTPTTLDDDATCDSVDTPDDNSVDTPDNSVDTPDNSVDTPDNSVDSVDSSIDS